MSVLIQKSGLLSTIQDLGRKGFRQFGINPNGVMDSSAIRLINILLGNDETEAVLEMHFPAPEILFETDTIFTLGGANFSAKLDDVPIENWRSFFAQRGSVLKFEQKIFGNRTYLSVKGGFEIKKWLNSSSTNLLAEIGGFEGRNLQIGDRIEFNGKRKMENEKFKNQDSKSIQKLKFPYKISNDLIPRYSSFPTVRIVAGAEFERLTAWSEQSFLKQDFTISNESNRMGFRFCGEPLYLLDEIELVSSAVGFGTIQLLPDGQIIILMADHQTSGGYPRIAHVVSSDLPVVAQLGANDKVGFELISLQEAENLLLEAEKDLNFLRIGCQFR
ncbi:MAG TPA: biotin-dependent carboxyltransferase family protein, partial [Pyrinomonadaceae bacterium]|nr:biotin-dependent carboxyltransferase family protein [Pyrinomonadaceae bacterium]